MWSPAHAVSEVPTCVKVHKVHNHMSIGPMSMVACGRPTDGMCVILSELARRGVLYRPDDRGRIRAV